MLPDTLSSESSGYVLPETSPHFRAARPPEQPLSDISPLEEDVFSSKFVQTELLPQTILAGGARNTGISCSARAQGVKNDGLECPVLSAFFFALGGAKAAEVMAAPGVELKMPMSGRVTPGQTLKYLKWLIFHLPVG
jgi:hypothetical protein